LAAWGLLVCGAVAASMPWQQLAEASVANRAMQVGSLLLPAAALWQVALALRQRRAGRAWMLEAVAALAVLAGCATLAAFVLLPRAPWRW
jgi:hypothetical protein